MNEYVYYNGSLSNYNEAKIPIYDRSLFFGDGVYEVIIGESGKLYRKEEHFIRLISSARAIDLPTSGVLLELKRAIKELVLLTERAPFSLYIQLSRRGDRRNHVYDSGRLPNLLICVTERKNGFPFPASKIITSEDKRYSMCNVKSLNLLPNVLLAKKAEDKGADEGVFIKNGQITEASRANVLILKSNELISHPTDSDILDGITKNTVLSLARRSSLQVVERPFYLYEMMNADEVFLTSTTKFLRRCSHCDGKSIGMKDEKTANMLIKLLQDDYFATIDG